MSIADSFKVFGAKQALKYVDKDFEHNAIKMCDWLIEHDKGGGVKNEATMVRNVLLDKDSNWYQLVKSVYTEIDDGQRRKLMENFVINACMIGTPTGFANSAKYDCNVPWAILMDPTSGCNLHCTGCWAAEYGNKLNLTLEELDSVIAQAEELGCYFFIYSGGEPLVRKKDIITLCERHPEAAFLSFTNGTLIDEAFADEMLRVKNFVPAISIEGFEDATDDRRGKGTYQKVVRAMNILRERKLLFGASCCYTSKNVDVIGSEAYYDSLIDLGAKFMWLFTYMPVGADAVPELATRSHCSRWISGTMVNTLTGALPADGVICISTPMGMWNPAPSFITAIPISEKKRCWKHYRAPSLWSITGDSPLMTTCCAPARFWTIRGVWRKW